MIPRRLDLQALGHDLPGLSSSKPHIAVLKYNRSDVYSKSPTRLPAVSAQALQAQFRLMYGTIRGRHLLTHGPLIVRLFGFRAYVRCLVRTLQFNSAPVTFLGTLNETFVRNDSSRSAVN